MNKLYILLAILLMNCNGEAQNTNNNSKNNKNKNNTMKYNELTPQEEAIILHKGTERPFSGIYNDHWKRGTYTCKQCGSELYKSDTKFDGHCGWPSFDDEIEGAVKRVPDADGLRTEIVCANCNGHLGHVFIGEGFTDKNTRHCVNSVSLNFEPVEVLKMAANNIKTAYFAGGCFWGMEFYFQRENGVIATDVGYMGGNVENPTYRAVCSGKTGHYEIIKVDYDPVKINYETLARLFYEIHDPTQINGQGPDLGQQYMSVAFYNDDFERIINEKLIKELKDNGFKVVTKLLSATKFWIAEDYHQDYYEKNGHKPYCHSRTKRF